MIATSIPEWFYVMTPNILACPERSFWYFKNDMQISLFHTLFIFLNWLWKNNLLGLCGIIRAIIQNMPHCDTVRQKVFIVSLQNITPHLVGAMLLNIFHKKKFVHQCV